MQKNDYQEYYEINCSICGRLKIPDDDEYRVIEDTSGLQIIYVCGHCEAVLAQDILSDGDDISQEEINFLDWCDSQ